MTDAILFAGQGAQYVGMGADLIGLDQNTEAMLRRVDQVLGEPLTEIMFNGPESALTLTENTQPAVLALGIAHFTLGRNTLGIEPRVALGHSLGEYAAWVAAGSFAVEDALRLVRLRGQAMQEAVPVGVGAMSAIISAGVDDIDAICTDVARDTGQVVSISIYNCPGNTVISGHKEAVAAVEARIDGEGLGAAISLSVSAPFHCELLAPAAERLKAALAAVKVEPNALDVIPNVTGEVVEPGADPDMIRRFLVDQVVQPVRWEASLRTALDLGVTRAVSMGPGKALKSHMKRVSRRFPMVVLDVPGDRQALMGEG